MKARMPAGFGRPDMNALMRQAQKMQEDMKAKQAELEAARGTFDMFIFDSFLPEEGEKVRLS